MQAVKKKQREEKKRSEFDVTAQLGGPVQGLEIRSKAPGSELTHLKSYCVDNRLLRTGSANFSRFRRDAPGQRSGSTYEAASVCARLRREVRSSLGEELKKGPKNRGRKMLLRN